MKQVEIFSGGEYVRGTLQGPYDSESEHPGVVAVHGWSSSQKKYVERFKKLAQERVVCLTISLRGHGESDGDINTLSRNDHLADIKATYTHLSHLASVNPGTIGMFGKSYGGYLTAITALILRPRTVVLAAPALYPDRDFNVATHVLIEKDPNIYRQVNETHENRALRSLLNYKNPMLLIYFGQDEDILAQTIEQYLSLQEEGVPLATYFLPESDHVMSEKRWDDEVTRVLTHWFLQELGE